MGLKIRTSRIFFKFELGIGGFDSRHGRIVWKISSCVHLLEFEGAVFAPVEGKFDHVI
jgi:hypothetical protein